MVKEIKNNIALIAVFVLSFAMPAFATYTPPVGNNNDVQYKNGFGFAGSDNFVVNGTNIGIGTFQPFALFSIGTNNGTGVLGSPGGFQVDSKGSLTMYGDDGTAYFLGNVHTHEIGTDNNIFDDGDGNVNLAGVLNVNSSNNNISPEFAVNDFNDSIALQVNDDDSGKGDYVQTLNNVIDDGNGNVGIGTVHPNNSLIVAIGNVGIGTAFPGQKLDVQGTVRAMNFVGNGSGLTGISGSNYWLNTAGTGNVGISTTNTVGIGTTSEVGAGLVVMNGNVGIGTWKPVGGLIVLNGNVGIGYNSPGSPLSVNGITTASGFEENSSQSELAGGDLTLNSGGAVIWTNGGSVSNTNDTGLTRLSAGVLALGNGNASDTSGTLIASNIGIGTLVPKGALIIKTGNVGIGSFTPGQALDVQGTVRAMNFVGNGSGLTGISGGSNWTYTSSGNVGLSTTVAVGIGTTFVGGTGEAALSIMNGNVGIGTWVPNSGLQMAQSFAVYRTGTAAGLTTSGQTIIGVTSTASARTITLATVDTVPGRVIIIKDESGAAGTNNITVNTQSGQTIDGASSVSISANYGVLRVYPDGSNWYTF